MGRTLSRSACSDCNSSNNLCNWEAENGDILQQCKTPGCEKNRIRKVSSTVVNSSYPRSGSVTMNSEPFLSGEYKSVRGLSPETCEKMGISSLGDTIIFQYNNAQKVRYHDKTFSWIKFNKEIGLFGQSQGLNYEEKLIITEGELDAASLVERGYQAVSIGTGLPGGVREIEEQITEINKFHEIVFWFDNDMTGNAGLQDIFMVPGLALHKVSYIKSGTKDANDALIAGTLDDEVEKAIQYVPEGLVFAKNIDPTKLLIPEAEGLDLPFPLLTETLRGVKKGRLYLLGAGTGVGKSTFTKEIIYHWLKVAPKTKIAAIYLEESQKDSLQSLIALHVNKPHYLIAENPDPDDIQKGVDFLKGSNMAFLDHFGSLTEKKLFKMLEYLAISQKYDILILDHLSIVVSGMASREGERKDIDILMTKLRELIEKSGITVIAVSHLNRPQGDLGYEQGRQVSLNSFRGSGSLAQLSDVVISLERNQQNETEKNKVLVRVLKNRITGKLGKTDTLYFHESTGRLRTLDNIFGD